MAPKAKAKAKVASAKGKAKGAAKAAAVKAAALKTKASKVSVPKAAAKRAAGNKVGGATAKIAAKSAVASSKAAAAGKGKAEEAAKPEAKAEATRGKTAKASEAEKPTEVEAPSHLPAAPSGSAPNSKRRKTGAGGLPVEVLDLMDFIANPFATVKHMMEAGLDVAQLPLEKVSKDVVRGGYTWLKALEGELSKPVALRSPQTLAMLSASFRGTVPLQDGTGGDSAVAPVDSVEGLQRCLEVVELLGDIEVAHAERRTLHTTGEGVPQEQLVELYRKLKCDIRPVAPGAPAHGMVVGYLLSSQDPAASGFEVKVRRVFEVDRAVEQNRFARHAQNPNRVLLWQGAPASSYLGLLAHGPRIAPKEAPDVGYPFGRGVYFWDSASEAARKCHATRSTSRSLLMLAEVALGTSRKLLAPDRRANVLPAGCESVHGFGLHGPDPEQVFRTPEGVLVHMGAPKLQSFDGFKSSMDYNQFVVYNPAQVRMRYLVEVDVVYT